MLTHRAFAPGLALVAASLAAWPAAAEPVAGHGPHAPEQAFPSHVFQWQAREVPSAELSFDYGLTQPILLGGFNASIDLRFERYVLTYSHGQGLEYDRVPGALSAAEQRAGVSLSLPVTTGFGAGVVLVDELYALVDLKLHHFVLRTASARESYDTVTLGAEIGWRFFVWRGFHITLVLRYWPNVWTSAPKRGVLLTTSDGTTLGHAAAQQGYGGSGVFANVLLGWAFEI